MTNTKSRRISRSLKYKRSLLAAGRNQALSYQIAQLEIYLEDARAIEKAKKAVARPACPTPAQHETRREAKASRDLEIAAKARKSALKAHKAFRKAKKTYRRAKKAGSNDLSELRLAKSDASRDYNQREEAAVRAEDQARRSSQALEAAKVKALLYEDQSTSAAPDNDESPMVAEPLNKTADQNIDLNTSNPIPQDDEMRCGSLTTTEPHNNFELFISNDDDEPLDLATPRPEDSPSLAAQLPAPLPGSSDDPIDADTEQTSPLWTAEQQTAEDLENAKLLTRFESLLADQDPIAMVCQIYDTILGANPEIRIGKRFSHVQPIQFKQFLPNAWFADEILNAWMGILCDKNPKLGMILSTSIEFGMEGLDQLQGDPGKAVTMPYVDIANGVENILIPVNVSSNHWILCVATFSSTNRFEGDVCWYDSIKFCPES